MARYFLVTISFLIVAQGVASLALGATWRVEQNGSGQFTELQPAVDAAASGDTILVGPGWYQELNWFDNYGYPVEVAAYWVDDRDLTFIGTGIEEVKVGPPEYTHPVIGPNMGIYGEGEFVNQVSVVGIAFENMYRGVLCDNVVVDDCSFTNCYTGLVANGGDLAIVTDSEFKVVRSTACWFTACDTVEVSRCTLGGRLVFAAVGMGVVRDCFATGNQFVVFNMSNGLLENNTANCGNGEIINAFQESSVVVRSNRLSGGAIGVLASGAGTQVSVEETEILDSDLTVIQLENGAVIEGSGNDFRKNPGLDRYLVRCSGFWNYEEPVIMNLGGNSWAENGTGVFSTSAQISTHIIDYNDNENIKVLIDYEPFSAVPVPAKKETLGSIKAMFR